MAKEQKMTLWKRSTDTMWKRVLIAACMVLAIPLVGIGIAESSYQARVGKLTAALDKFAQDLGGVNQGLGISSHCTHSWDAFWAIDTGPCPLAGGTVWAAVASGEQSVLAADTLKKEGYSVTLGADSSDQRSVVGGAKDGMGLSVEMIVTDSNAPKQALPEGKKWVRFNIRAEETN